jgi:hypothetical protein
VSLGGGDENQASGILSWIGGVQSNTSGGPFATVFGGKELAANVESEALR